jgi:hypothetical protein
MKDVISTLREKIEDNNYKISQFKRIIDNNPEIYKIGFVNGMKTLRKFNRELKKAIKILKENSPCR